MTQRTLAWLPAHPAMGWASMNRYWQALQHCQQKYGAAHWRILCPLRMPAVEQQAASAWKRWLARRVLYPARVSSVRADAVHVLDHSFSDLLRYCRPGVKRIITVHDLIPLYDSTGLSARQVSGFRHRVAQMQQAERLLPVSHYTQQCIAEQFPTAAGKAHVLPLGVEVPAAGSSLQRSCSILSVGSTLARKNLQILPSVLQHLKNRGISPLLWRIGSRLPAALKAEITAVIGENAVCELGFVSDAELTRRYQTAGLVLFPSTMEGFGLPVLEAMAHGCPVVCSSATSIPEVAGTAALLFSPQDAATAAEHCYRLLIDSTLAAHYTAQGRLRAQHLSWERHWQHLLAEYEEAMN